MGATMGREALKRMRASALCGSGRDAETGIIGEKCREMSRNGDKLLHCREAGEQHCPSPLEGKIASALQSALPSLVVQPSALK